MKEKGNSGLILIKTAVFQNIVSLGTGYTATKTTFFYNC